MRGWGVILVLWPAFCQALPLLDTAISQELSRLTVAPATRFLEDDAKKDLTYAVLSRLVVTKEEQGKPLFRMVQNKDGSADIFVIVQLAPAKSFEEDFHALKIKNPDLKVALLPVATGKLKVSLLDGGQVSLLAESSEINNAYLNATMPLQATISAEGIEKIRASLATQSGVLLALVFEYSFKAITEGAPLKFKVRPGKLQEQIVGDPDFSKALGAGSGLSIEWGQRQVRRALAIDLNAMKPILPLNPVDSDNYPLLAWGALMQLFPKILLSEDATEWLSFEALKKIRDRADLPDVIEVESRPQRSIQLAQSQAGGLLKGICTDFSELVYRYDGTSHCDALIPPATTPLPVPMTTPPPAEKPKPGDDTPDRDLTLYWIER